MLIAVNTKLLLKNRLEGMGWFGYETLKRITRNHPEHKFLFIFDRPWDDSFIFSDNIIPVKTTIPSRHALLWYLRFEHIIPRIVKKYKADLFLSTDGWTTLCPDFKTYDVIHDINPIHQPKDYPFCTRKYYQHYYPRFAKNVTRLGTVSAYSKNDIICSLGIDPDKIDVIYNGANTIYSPLGNEERMTSRKVFAQGEPYFVYVGSLNPRKNIERMLEAFDAFKISSALPHKLVIVGEKMWSYPGMEKELKRMQFRNDVLFTGRLNPADLRRVLGGAEALLLVSILEGFGIPLIEAMQCDVPVVTSNITAMPEIAGDAGLLVDPYSVASITDALLQIARDESLRSDLVKRGRLQRENFSWDKSAENLWNGIEKCFS